MDVLKITHDNGDITIDVELFFPCNARKLKVLKSLLTDEQAVELVQQLKDMVAGSEEMFVKYGKQYHNDKQTLSEMERVIESGKMPNGVRVSPDEVTRYKETVKYLKKNIKTVTLEAKKCLSKTEKLKKNIEVLEI